MGFRERSSVRAFTRTARQLGGALGAALLGAVFFGYLDGHQFQASLIRTTR
jgi:hypothetical protein